MTSSASSRSYRISTCLFSDFACLLWNEDLQHAPLVGRSDVWLFSANGDIPDEDMILAM